MANQNPGTSMTLQTQSSSQQMMNARLMLDRIKASVADIMKHTIADTIDVDKQLCDEVYDNCAEYLDQMVKQKMLHSYSAKIDYVNPRVHFWFFVTGREIFGGHKINGA
jgi:propanediol dehydratase large subunit